MSRPVLSRAWHVAPQDRARVAQLARALGVPRLVAHLLTLGEVTTAEAGDRFLNPSLAHVSDPFLLTDMRAAVDRLVAARDRRERVLVFGDYDVDGIAGTAILVGALRRFGIADCAYALPHRLTEGYGLSPEHVRTAHADGANLIVTVDNGVTAHEAAETARALGVDLIITDHHDLDRALPPAAAIVNPKRESGDHPAAHLCGAAVALKLAWALTGEVHDLDLAALGTIADIVPLRGENRALTALGLAWAGKHPRLGLLKLAQQANIRIEAISSTDVAYQLAPRINAGGRVGDGHLGLRLLLLSHADPEAATEAARMAAELNAANEERRTIENRIYEVALHEIEQSFSPSQHAIVLASREWHPGVIGIVASRLQSRYYRPIVLISINGDGVGRGSARSIADLDIGQTIAACGDHLVQFGGHKAAAGLTIREDAIPAFREAFEAEAARRLPEGEPRPHLDVAAQVSLSEITSQLVQAIERLQPFGHGNPAPVFCTYGARPMPNSVREARGGHLRLAVQEGSRLFQAIGFGMGDRIPDIVRAESIDIAFTPQFNTFRGETSVQLLLKDAHTA